MRSTPSWNSALNDLHAARRNVIVYPRGCGRVHAFQLLLCACGWVPAALWGLLGVLHGLAVQGCHVCVGLSLVAVVSPAPDWLLQLHLALVAVGCLCAFQRVAELGLSGPCCTEKATPARHPPANTMHANTTHVQTAGSSAAQRNQTILQPDTPAQKAKYSYKWSHPTPHEADEHTSHVHKNAPSLVD